MSQHQPVPVVTDADVERIARRDYPTSADDVLALLNSYGAESWHREVPRVRVAVLRLGAGSVETLKKHLDYALRDTAPPSPELVERVVGQFRARGLPVS